jgi:Domain of unknown function (DUF4261)
VRHYQEFNSRVCIVRIRFLVLISLVFGLSSVVIATERSKPEQSQVQVLSFVAVAEPKLPDSQRFRASLQERLGDTRLDGIEADEQVILLRIRGGTVGVGLVERPLPKGEIEHICKWAWYWRSACDAMASHKAHLIVTLLGTDLHKVAAALLQTKVIAALMDSNAIASYWGTSLQSKDAFLKQSARSSPENLPVWLWVNFRMTNDKETGWTISTRDMDSFGLYEIESRDVKIEGLKLFSMISGMSEYLIKKGPVIKDGETIGDSPAENIRVRHAPSYWNEGKTAYRVVFPAK